MSDHDPTRDCEHGRLKGKCDVCDLQAEVERINRVNAELVGALKELLLVSGRYGGWMVEIKRMDEAFAKADAALAKAIGDIK
jgi:hypothetical protein